MKPLSDAFHEQGTFPLGPGFRVSSARRFWSCTDSRDGSRLVDFVPHIRRYEEVRIFFHQIKKDISSNEQVLKIIE